MSLVAISAAYGAGGSRIGPALAQRLGVPFLDRAIPTAVAERLEVGVEQVEDLDERAPAGLLERMLQQFVSFDTGVAAIIPPVVLEDEDFRVATEQVLRAQAGAGEGVILGRGSAFALRDDPRALRVRLRGPAERRIPQAMALQGIDRQAAERALHRLDRAHSAYVRHFYGVSIDDPAQYDVVLDSTRLPIDDCLELLAIAARAIRLSDGPAGSDLLDPVRHRREGDGSSYR